MIKKKFENKNDIFTLIVNDFSEEYLNDILMLEKKCFPPDWQYDNAIEYYLNILKNKNNINILLKKDNETVGYILAIPHNDMVDDLLKDDKFLEKKINFYYIETIQITPRARGIGGAEKLLKVVCGEAKKRGINNFSIHARTLNGFADKVKKIFDGNINLVRNIKRWKYGGNEVYEYIEWDF